MHPFKLFLQDAAAQAGLLDAKMRARGADDRGAVAQPGPLPGQIVGAVLHAVPGRAGVMVDQEDVHGDGLLRTSSSPRPRAASSRVHKAANRASLPASRLLQRGIAMAAASAGL